MKLTLSRGILEDIGLIRKAEFIVSDGLTVFTGETGSGKTMLLGGLGLGLGGRASSDIVRAGASRARVMLAFDVDDEACEFLDQAGFPLDPGEHALFERDIFASGKSAARLNGRIATAARIRELLAVFVERVGQHDQQRLLDPREHLDLVDRYGGSQVLQLRDRVATSFAELRAYELERAELMHERERGIADREEAQEALAAIDELAIAPGEDVALRQKREHLQHAEKITRSLQNVHEALHDDDDAAVSQIGRSVASLREIERFDPEYADLASRLLAMQSELSEVARSLSRDLGNDDAHAQELEAIDHRLEKIERLKRRHGGSIEGIEAARRKFSEMSESRSQRDRRLNECTEKCRVAAEHLDEDAARLTLARAEAAHRLGESVGVELAAVAMASANFQVHVTPLERIAATGAERIEFLLAPNAKAVLRPISKVASGGELSRILLALTVVLAANMGASIMIFDEIDAGIGGATASAVGERLYRLGRSVQVLCVTHLAQLAAFGDAHYTVEKAAEEGAAQIRIRALTKREEVVTEIARMLSGSNTDVAREHASDLLARRPKAESLKP